ncbi:cysteine desulfurase family protein [Pseudolactococcus insecticola]|uniref:cysteine desulfurase n=1 Tax=Pseudolactococcus insecticola TaxID=2709158 RepID=A0A6A0B687_9LACT|nr:cysteine desulfurase family protein [Lactococcus insecticola]GFH40920.1 aminotransferase [Lactococcus insecticola]
MIYLDNAATTPVLPEVAQDMFDVLTTTFGNPSSIHSYGRAAGKVVRDARKTIATILDVPVRNLIFTSGGSEANNQAIIGYALANRDKGNHILTTAIEHHSVLHAVEYLRDRHGFEVTFVKPHADGSFTADLIADALRDDTILVSTMYANNETGQILPIAEISQLLTTHQAVYHVDAVQVMGKIAVEPVALGIDFLSASAHKFHGPKGVGFLYHSDLKFDNLIHGGDQEEGRRAGTENIHSIVGMARALAISAENLETNFDKVTALKTQLLSELQTLDFYTNHFGEAVMPHVLNLGFPGVNQDLLLMKLDLQGVAISTGSACTAGAIEPSHVLAAVYGDDDIKLKESVRVSLSDMTTSDEIHGFIKILTDILQG